MMLVAAIALPILWLFAFDQALRNPPPSLHQRVEMTHIAATMTAEPVLTLTAAAPSRGQ